MPEDVRPKVREWLRQNVSAAPAAASRYELLDGEQISLPPPTDAHAACIIRLTKLLSEAAGDQVALSVQNPLLLSEQSQACPDLVLLAPRGDGYVEASVRPQDVLLLVEVSDTNFAVTHDRGRKASYYARSGIAECWIVDLVSQQVLVHSAPASGGYQDIRNLRSNATIGDSSLTGVSLDCSEILCT